MVKSLFELSKQIQKVTYRK